MIVDNVIKCNRDFFGQKRCGSMQNRKKVAVFVSNMYGALVRDMQVGIQEAALEEGVKLIFFASFSDSFSREVYDQYIKYDEGDIVPFKIPNLRDFDGAILLSTSFPAGYKERIDGILTESGIPVINLGGLDDRYYSVINDEKKSFGTIVEHLIEKHGCKDIYHIAGKPMYEFTHLRIQSYKEVMTSHGLDCSDDKIYFGTLWRDCGKPGVEYVLEQCKKEGKDHPDAIVCANDYMAIGVMDALRERNLRVPEDVIVTGYDGIDVAYLGYPSITTSQQPFFDAGRESIFALEKLWDGEKLERIISVYGKISINQSCGCVSKEKNNIEAIRQVYGSRSGKMEYLSQSTTNMILGMSSATDIEECYKEIEKNAMTDTGFKDFLLCMAPDWDKQIVIDDNSVIKNEKMTVVAGFRGDKLVPRQTFDVKDILPQDMLEDPNPYYIFSIHHLQYYMGYIIVSPTLDDYNQLIMKSWLVNLGAMLENWRIRNELNVTVERLKNLYNRDMLTGLYNRRGYEPFFEKMYNSCVKNKTSLAVMVADMDDLKEVNDNFGHSEGDYSLCTIADGMNKAARNNEICFRTGGDEFVILAGDYSEEKAEQYIKQLRNYISDCKKRDGKPYKLDVSVGIYIEAPKGENDMSVLEISENYMKLADVEMYKEKKAHKAGRD